MDNQTELIACILQLGEDINEGISANVSISKDKNLIEVASQLVERHGDTYSDGAFEIMLLRDDDLVPIGAIERARSLSALTKKGKYVPDDIIVVKKRAAVTARMVSPASAASVPTSSAPPSATASRELSFTPVVAPLITSKGSESMDLSLGSNISQDKPVNYTNDIKACVYNCRNVAKEFVMMAKARTFPMVVPTSNLWARAVHERESIRFIDPSNQMAIQTRHKQANTLVEQAIAQDGSWMPMAYMALYLIDSKIAPFTYALPRLEYVAVYAMLLDKRIGEGDPVANTVSRVCTASACSPANRDEHAYSVVKAKGDKNETRIPDMVMGECYFYPLVAGYHVPYLPQNIEHWDPSLLLKVFMSQNVAVGNGMSYNPVPDELETLMHSVYGVQKGSIKCTHTLEHCAKKVCYGRNEHFGHAAGPDSLTCTLSDLWGVAVSALYFNQVARLEARDRRVPMLGDVPARLEAMCAANIASILGMLQQHFAYNAADRLPRGYDSYKNFEDAVGGYDRSGGPASVLLCPEIGCPDDVPSVFGAVPWSVVIDLQRNSGSESALWTGYKSLENVTAASVNPLYGDVRPAALETELANSFGSANGKLPWIKLLCGGSGTTIVDFLDEKTGVEIAAARSKKSALQQLVVALVDSLTQYARTQNKTVTVVVPLYGRSQLVEREGRYYLPRIDNDRLCCDFIATFALKLVLAKFLEKPGDFVRVRLLSNFGNATVIGTKFVDDVVLDVSTVNYQVLHLPPGPLGTVYLWRKSPILAGTVTIHFSDLVSEVPLSAKYNQGKSDHSEVEADSIKNFNNLLSAGLELVSARHSAIHSLGELPSSHRNGAVDEGKDKLFLSAVMHFALGHQPSWCLFDEFFVEAANESLGLNICPVVERPDVVQQLKTVVEKQRQSLRSAGANGYATLAPKYREIYLEHDRRHGGTTSARAFLWKVVVQEWKAVAFIVRESLNQQRLTDLDAIAPLLQLCHEVNKTPLFLLVDAGVVMSNVYELVKKANVPIILLHVVSDQRNGNNRVYLDQEKNSKPEVVRLAPPDRKVLGQLTNMLTSLICSQQSSLSFKETQQKLSSILEKNPNQFHRYLGFVAFASVADNGYRVAYKRIAESWIKSAVDQFFRNADQTAGIAQRRRYKAFQALCYVALIQENQRQIPGIAVDSLFQTFSDPLNGNNVFANVAISEKITQAEATNRYASMIANSAKMVNNKYMRYLAVGSHHIVQDDTDNFVQEVLRRATSSTNSAAASCSAFKVSADPVEFIKKGVLSVGANINWVDLPSTRSGDPEHGNAEAFKELLFNSSVSTGSFEENSVQELCKWSEGRVSFIDESLASMFLNVALRILWERYKRSGVQCNYEATSRYPLVMGLMRTIVCDSSMRKLVSDLSKLPKLQERVKCGEYHIAWQATSIFTARHHVPYTLDSKTFSKSISAIQKEEGKDRSMKVLIAAETVYENNWLVCQNVARYLLSTFDGVLEHAIDADLVMARSSFLFISLNCRLVNVLDNLTNDSIYKEQGTCDILGNSLKAFLRLFKELLKRCRIPGSFTTGILDTALKAQIKEQAVQMASDAILLGNMARFWYQYPNTASIKYTANPNYSKEIEYVTLSMLDEADCWAYVMELVQVLITAVESRFGIKDLKEHVYNTLRQEAKKTMLKEGFAYLMTEVNGRVIGKYMDASLLLDPYAVEAELFENYSRFQANWIYIADEYKQQQVSAEREVSIADRIAKLLDLNQESRIVTEMNLFKEEQHADINEDLLVIRRERIVNMIYSWLCHQEHTSSVDFEDQMMLPVNADMKLQLLDHSMACLPHVQQPVQLLAKVFLVAAFINQHEIPAEHKHLRQYLSVDSLVDMFVRHLPAQSMGKTDAASAYEVSRYIMMLRFSKICCLIHVLAGCNPSDSCTTTFSNLLQLEIRHFRDANGFLSSDFKWSHGDVANRYNELPKRRLPWFILGTPRSSGWIEESKRSNRLVVQQHIRPQIKSGRESHDNPTSAASSSAPQRGAWLFGTVIHYEYKATGNITGTITMENVAIHLQFTLKATDEPGPRVHSRCTFQVAFTPWYTQATNVRSVQPIGSLSGEAMLSSMVVGNTDNRLGILPRNNPSTFGVIGQRRPVSSPSPEATAPPTAPEQPAIPAPSSAALQQAVAPQPAASVKSVVVTSSAAAKSSSPTNMVPPTPSSASSAASQSAASLAAVVPAAPAAPAVASRPIITTPSGPSHDMSSFSDLRVKQGESGTPLMIIGNAQLRTVQQHLYGHIYQRDPKDPASPTTVFTPYINDYPNNSCGLLLFPLRFVKDLCKQLVEWSSSASISMRLEGAACTTWGKGPYALGKAVLTHPINPTASTVAKQSASNCCNSLYLLYNVPSGSLCATSEGLIVLQYSGFAERGYRLGILHLSSTIPRSLALEVVTKACQSVSSGVFSAGNDFLKNTVLQDVPTMR